MKDLRPFVGDCKAGPATPPGKSGPRETNVEFLLHAVPFYSLIASGMKWPQTRRKFEARSRNCEQGVPDFTGHPKIIEKPERDRFRRACFHAGIMNGGLPSMSAAGGCGHFN
jgi:hypothetical protein